MRQGNFMKGRKYTRLLHALVDSGLGHVTALAHGTAADVMKLRLDKHLHIGDCPLETLPLGIPLPCY